MSSDSSTNGSSEPEYVDKTPAGHAQQAALPSGEVLQEYGVVDLNDSFPSESYEWESDYPLDAPTERHVVVPFRVVKRGIKNLRSAKRMVERLEEENGGSYKAVMLSDPRGL